MAPFLVPDLGVDKTPVVNITAPPECLFVMDHFTWFDSMNEFLLGALDAQCGGEGTSSDTFTCRTRDGSHQRMGPFWFDGLATKPDRGLGGISQYMDNVAESMTRKFRMGLNGEPWDNITGVRGSVWQTMTCFHVEWKWLLLPSALTLLVAAVLAWTLLSYTCGWGRGQMVWKSSILPLLYHQDRFVPADGDETRPTEGLEHKSKIMSWKDMQRDAKRTKVSFKGEDI
jgi:hypothetical protein